MVKAKLSKNMFALTDTRRGRCARWCALVVLLAACSLAVSVATRYGFVEGATAKHATAKTPHRESSQGHTRQRLTKDASNWIPPVIAWLTLQAPTPYSRVACDPPVIPNPSFDSSLYYRPPPAFLPLS